MNLSSILLLCALVCVVALALHSVRKHKGGCGSCPGCDACREREYCRKSEKK